MKLVLIFSYLLISVNLMAETIPTKAGLWATSTEVFINNNKMPNILTLKGIQESQKTQLKSSLKKLGLPEGAPSLDCVSVSEFNLDNYMQKMSSQGCKLSDYKAKRAGSNLTMQLSCEVEKGVKLSGKAEATGLGTNKVIYKADLAGKVQGKNTTYKTIVTNVYIGTDCKKIPSGFSDDMMNLPYTH